MAVGLVGGGTVSALLAWVLSGLVDWVPPAVAFGILLVTCVAAIARDLGVIRFKLPQNHHQIPRTVVTLEPLGAGLRFGFELGLGFRTYITTTAPYVLAAGLLLIVEHGALALLVGAGFGFGRALLPVARYNSRDEFEWDAALSARVRTLFPRLSAISGFAVGTLVVLGATA